MPMGTTYRAAFQCVCSMDDTCANILTNLPCSLWKIFLTECDGAIIASSHSFEDASLIQMKEWLKTLPRNLPLYPFGPLLPPGCGRRSIESSESEKLQVERDIKAFLKDMQAKHGEKSVVFVGFFSFPIGHRTNAPNIYYSSDRFWDDQMAYGAGVHRRGYTSAYWQRGSICMFSSPILIRRYSYILYIYFFIQVMCHASPYAKFPEEMANDIKSTGLGLLTT